jgi:DNA helicase-2/ATP-dependent DNA helicase PcrA
MREHRVIGPPGTGKTTYLKRQFEAAISSGRYGPADLFACSLTRAAATELASRVPGVPQRNVGTLHSHAYRALHHPAIVETTAGLKEWNEYCGAAAWRIGTQHAANPENAPAEPPGADSDGIKFLQDMGVLRQRMVGRELWPVGVQAFAKKWDEFKIESNRLDFTDLIEGALEHIDALPGCRVLFCDEAQDMSKLEFALVRKWGSKCDEFIIVGDPDQNLYEWRGSDPDAFYSTEAASERVLEHSYRVPQAVHQVALAWVKQIPDRKDAAYYPTDQSGGVEYRNHAFRNPESLVDDIVDRLAGTDGDNAMVLGSCTFMLSPIASRLRELGIPFHNPYRSGFHPWNPVKSSHRLTAFLRPSPEVWGTETRIWNWRDLHAWASVLQSSKVFTRGFKSVIESRLVEDRFGDSSAETLVPLSSLMENLKDDTCREAVMGMDIDWWENNLLHTQRKQSSFALTVARRHGAARLLEQPRIILGTIHSVKGGEADHVYLFPDLSAAGYWGAWKTSGRNRYAVVRQFYVGMTRAKQSLTLLEGSSDMAVKWLAPQ